MRYLIQEKRSNVTRGYGIKGISKSLFAVCFVVEISKSWLIHSSLQSLVPTDR